MKTINWSLIALVVLAAPAAAQEAATVREIERVVKVVRGSSSALQDARIGSGLAVGDRVRTGGRSAAGIRFTDATLIRIGELSQVRINGTRRSDAGLERGELLVDAKRPLRIQGSRSVAAVRGTLVSFIVDADGKEDSIQCYDGEAYVSTLDNPLLAGTAQQVGPTTLTDPMLEEPTDDFVGGQIRFVEGPYAGEARRITALDQARGTVTFAPALEVAPDRGGPHGYLLVKRPEVPVIRLTRNTGTRVRVNEPPEAPQRVPAKEFARLRRHPYFRKMRDRLRQFVYNNRPVLVGVKEHTWVERQAIRELVRAFRFCCDLPRRPGTTATHAHLHSAFQEDTGRLRPPGSTPEARLFPTLVAADEPAGTGNRGQFRFEPFAFASDEADSLGARFRYQGVSGNTYMELGYRYALIDGESQHRVTEGFLETRGPLGSLTVGRQHRFLGPANNTGIGTLLGFEAVDAAVWELPLKGSFQQEVAYVLDTRALSGRGFAAGYARGTKEIGPGTGGYSLLLPVREGRQLGWSLDIAQPLIRNTLDAYAEGGSDTFGRRVITGGVYVPWLYHRHGVDLFLEYAQREAQDERVSVRIRKEIGKELLLIGFIDRELGTSFFTAGGGIMWSKRFR